LPEYRFLTTWLIEAPREDVFQAIWDAERWPTWWRGVEDVVKVEDGDEEGRGSLGRYTWKSRLPYELTFEMRIDTVERPLRMIGTSVGDLQGEGRWRLFEQDGVTAVLYEWDVKTTEWWMNLFAPLARPLFAWNHDWVMRRGGEGLARLLGARLLASD
jgi:uncharacterized protein YndB with AHSA1/START domain